MAGVRCSILGGLSLKLGRAALLCIVMSSLSVGAVAALQAPPPAGGPFQAASAPPTWMLAWVWLLGLLAVVGLVLAWQRRKICPPVFWCACLLALAILVAAVLCWAWFLYWWYWWLLLLLTLAWLIWLYYFLYCKKPVECEVKVEAIWFNHDGSALTDDALNIRKDLNTTVELPEWKTGEIQPEESPAAYAIQETTGRTLTVKVKLSIAPTSVGQAEIKAEGGGVLGALDAQTVQFAGGVSVPEFVSFELSHHTIGAAGVKREDIAWQWKYRCPGDQTWRDADNTRHRIYVILETPKGPWDQTAGSQSNPWTDVLDQSCAWANTKTTRNDAAAEVTRTVNGSLGLTYDMNQGASKYTTPAAGLHFECTQFVDYLNGGGGKGNVVNCTDCATIVTTFANVLGCDLHAATMRSYFDLTQIKAIGQAGFGCPNWGCGFSYHEVAWNGGDGEADPLYDACLEVDGDGDPWAPPHTAQLALNMQFTTVPGAALPIPTPFNAASYRERLCTNNAGGIGSCAPDGPWLVPNSNGGRRKLK